ncbi:hypothetical protein JA1_001025 [Spathaspora sp. JA1]|nr:hypothetical protein JA1_001025 [Spathaspora sp. JA1]
MSSQLDIKLKHLRSIGFHNLYLTYENNKQVQPSPIRHSRRPRTGTITSIPEIDNLENNQCELIDVSNRRILDCFITIHLLNQTVIYVSEIQYSTINPYFQGITIPELPISCRKIIIKLWCRPQFEISSNTETPWHLLAVYRVKLGSNWIEIPSGDVDEEMFKPNSIVFEVKNRTWYTLYNLLKKKEKFSVATTKTTTVPSEPIKSYSFDSIRSIINLDNSLKELETSKYKLIHQINSKVHIIQDSNNVNNLSVLLGKLTNSCQTLANSINKANSINDSILSEIIQTKRKIHQFHQISTTHFQSIQETTLNQIELYDSEINPIKQSLVQTVYPTILTDLQTLVTSIQEIIPIENISGIQFSIVGFQFPVDTQELLNICYYNTTPTSGLKNSYYQPQFESQLQWHEFKISQINTALSYIVLLINILAYITNTHLKYNMVIIQNENYIIDSISETYPLSKTTGVFTKPFKFPLYYTPNNIEKLTKPQTTTSVNPGRYILMNQEFEYAIKLLNKNLVGLITNITKLYQEICPNVKDLGHNIPMDCLDNFLWNLKYLQLFMTAPF